MERHGTQLAGLLVGSGGPDGLQGVAPGRDRVPDPRRRLAARLGGPQCHLRPHRPADRGPRPGRRSRRRRRRPRRGAHRARRAGRAVRLLRRQPRVARRRGRARARHARGRARRERRRGRTAVRLARRAGRLAGGDHRRRHRRAADDLVGARGHAPRARRDPGRGSAAARRHALDAPGRARRRPAARRGHGDGGLVRRARLQHRGRACGPRRPGPGSGRVRARGVAGGRSRGARLRQDPALGRARHLQRGRHSRRGRAGERRAHAAAGPRAGLRHRRRRRQRALRAEQPHEPHRAVLLARPHVRRRREARPDRPRAPHSPPPIPERRPTARPPTPA